MLLLSSIYSLVLSLYCQRLVSHAQADNANLGLFCTTVDGVFLYFISISASPKPVFNKITSKVKFSKCFEHLNESLVFKRFL